MPKPSSLAEESRGAIVAFVAGKHPDTSVHLYEEGWDYVVAVADSVVYRFPRGAWARERIEAETEFLRRFGRLSPLRVPLPELFEQEPQHARYPFIPGDQLWPSELESWSSSEQRSAGERFGGFLSVLHGFPVLEALECGLKREAWAEAWWERDTEDFRFQVLPRLGPTGRLLAERTMDAADPTALGVPREAVVHNDLGPEHLLAEDRALVGVIDFGDAAVGDPALDFQWTLMYRIGGMHHEGDFLDSVLARYDHPIDDGFFKRVAAYRVYHGLRHVRDEARVGRSEGLQSAVELFEAAAKRLLSD